MNFRVLHLSLWIGILTSSNNTFAGISAGSTSGSTATPIPVVIPHVLNILDLTVNDGSADGVLYATSNVSCNVNIKNEGPSSVKLRNVSVPFCGYCQSGTIIAGQATASIPCNGKIPQANGTFDFSVSVNSELIKTGELKSFSNAFPIEITQSNLAVFQLSNMWVESVVWKDDNDNIPNAGEGSNVHGRFEIAVRNLRSQNLLSLNFGMFTFAGDINSANLYQNTNLPVVNGPTKTYSVFFGPVTVLPEAGEQVLWVNIWDEVPNQALRRNVYLQNYTIEP